MIFFHFGWKKDFWLTFHFRSEVLIGNTHNSKNIKNSKCILGVLNLGLWADFKEHFELHVSDNECSHFIFRRENFVVIIIYIKSSVDPKSEVLLCVILWNEFNSASGNEVERRQKL